MSLEKFGTPEVPIPDSFDARKKWPFCKSLQNLTDQGNCGSCWVRRFYFNFIYYKSIYVL